MTPDALALDLGGWVIAVASPEAPLLAALRRRYHGFLTSAPAVCTVHHEPQADGYLIGGERCFARVEPAAGRALVAGAGDPARIDGVLRTLLPEVIEDAVLLHAALLAEPSRGWVCCGGSGSGKSTLSRLLPERALCDEQVLLARTPAGFELRALPFWTARPGRVDLAGVHLLEHAPHHRREPVAPADALRLLARHVRWPEDARRAAASFELIAQVAAGVPVWRLGFAPRADVWELIRGEAVA